MDSKDLYRKIPYGKNMSRLATSILLFFFLSMALGSAYDLQVTSASKQEVVIELTNLKTLDVKVTDVEATVETATAYGSYNVDAQIERREGKIVLVADVGPIFQEHTDVDALVVRGTLSVEGIQDTFAKRVSYRTNIGISRATLSRAPVFESSIGVYLVTVIAVIVIFLVVVLLLPKKKRKKKSLNLNLNLNIRKSLNLKKRKAKKARKKRKSKR